MDHLKLHKEYEKKRIVEPKKDNGNSKQHIRRRGSKKIKPKKSLYRMFLYPDDFAFLKWKSSSMGLSVGELVISYIAAKRRTERKKEKDRDKERSNSLELLLKEISYK